MTVEQAIADVNARYDENIICRRSNNCKHQGFFFNCMMGTGRYFCGLHNQKNCIIRTDSDTCPEYEDKNQSRPNL